MKTSYVIAAVLTFAAGMLTAGASYAYEVPDKEKAKLIFEEKQVVKDRTPGTEILIRTYKEPDGKLFREYGVKGRVFRYDVDEDGAPPYEYRLTDADGDGVFETKEHMIGEIVVKDKGEKYYIDLGPEPGKEYRYSYEKEMGEVNMRQEAHILAGMSIYIPAWVLLEF